MRLLAFPLISLRASIACAVVMACSGPSDAADYTYRVTDLGELGFTPSTDEDLRTLFGINNQGEVVFCTKAWHESPLPGYYYYHAMVCLPSGSAYGLDAGVHDLNDLFSMDFPNVARDINVDGLVVGQIGGSGTGVGEAVAWDLAAEPEPEMIQLGALAGSSWSRAFAINDADPPVIVGESDALGWCPDLEDEECGWPTEEEDVLMSFVLTLEGGPPFDLAALGMLEQDCDQSSSVRDVADLGAGQWQAVGISCTYVLSEICFVSVGDCQEDDLPDDAAAWSLDGNETTVWELPSREPDRPSRGLGVNESGEAVGWGFDAGAQGCEPDALFWGSASPGDRVDLGDYMPAGQQGDQSMACAVNNLEHPQVVGWNAAAELALVWERNGATWTGINLEDEIDPDSGVDSLREALDINDDGWIVCWGDGAIPEPSFEPHCFLLTPLPDCHEDLNGDNLVDIDDVFEVVNNWGDAPLGVIWKWDVNSDFAVDIDDVYAVMAAWGPCEGDGGGGDQGLAAILSDWLADGGAAALDQNLVTWDEINACLANESEDGVETCLYGLLKD